uniref:Uncharacterized protein n=1 Tax=Amphiprion percula TaxID=161767 RepID=A0A3P8T4L4_AMPPE
MPIWSVMCSQVPGVPRDCSFAFTIVFTLSFLDSGVLRVMVVLTIFSIWERILFRLSGSRATTVRLPTRSPKFLENDWRTAQASFSKLPEANP